MDSMKNSLDSPAKPRSREAKWGSAINRTALSTPSPGYLRTSPLLDTKEYTCLRLADAHQIERRRRDELANRPYPINRFSPCKIRNTVPSSKHAENPPRPFPVRA